MSQRPSEIDYDSKMSYISKYSPRFKRTDPSSIGGRAGSETRYGDDESLPIGKAKFDSPRPSLGQDLRPTVREHEITKTTQ